jgi:predicted RNA binding protein YcfA (HicA-like mRNA interferase family)
MKLHQAANLGNLYRTQGTGFTRAKSSVNLQIPSCSPDLPRLSSTSRLNVRIPHTLPSVARAPYRAYKRPEQGAGIEFRIYHNFFDGLLKCAFDAVVCRFDYVLDLNSSHLFRHLVPWQFRSDRRCTRAAMYATDSLAGFQFVDSRVGNYIQLHMDRLEKLLAAARNNPNGLSFKDFEALLRQARWKFDRQKGSHQIWYSPKNSLISIQSKDGKAKGYQVKQFLEVYNRESNG